MSHEQEEVGPGRREINIIIELVKNTAPIAATRFVTYFSDICVYTWVASRAGSNFLAEIVVPLSYMDASYWTLSALFGLGINIVRARVVLQDSSVAEYFFAGTALGVILPITTTFPLFLVVAQVLRLSWSATVFGGVLTGDVILRNIKMHSRQNMIGTGHRIERLDGAHVSLLSGCVEAGLFFGLSWWLVPQLELKGFVIARFSASGLKILLDSLFLRSSGRVFLSPNWKNVLADMKMIVSNGWKMSAQIFVELTVVSVLPILTLVEKAQARLIAFRLAATMDGALSPFTGAWARGMQRLIHWEDESHRSENIGLSNRAFGITLLTACIPLVMYVGSPRTFLSLFTSDVDVLHSGESIVRLFSSGQFFYILYAFLQSALWVLFEDSSYSMGTSIAAALLFFTITLPLLITGSGDFDVAMGMFVLYTGVGFLSLGGRYLNRIYSEEVTDAENAGCFGIFRSVPAEPPITRIEPMADFMDEDSRSRLPRLA